MTRLALLEKLVDLRSGGLEVKHMLRVYDDRERIGSYEYDPESPTLRKDIEWARKETKPGEVK